MAVISVTLTEDMLKLISHINFTKIPDLTDETQEKMTWGLDFNSLYGGSYVFEDIAYILGRYDEHIAGTEEDPMGVAFPQELEDYMWKIHSYVLDNIQYIEALVHQFVNKGGLTPGTYRSKSNENIWTKLTI